VNNKLIRVKVEKEKVNIEHFTKQEYKTEEKYNCSYFLSTHHPY